MLKVLTSHKGKTHRLSLAEAIHSKTLAWIDINTPSEEEINKISKLFKINKSDLEDIMDPHERSRMEDNKNYHLIILRTPFKIKSEIKTSPLGIIITRNNILTIHKRQVKSLLDMHNNSEILDHGIQYFIINLINKMLSNYYKLTEQIDNDIEELEEKVFSHGGKSTAQHIFRLKKTLTFFQRSLLANRETISQLIKQNTLHLNQTDMINFGDLTNDINQLIDMTNTHKEILSSALEIHASTISNQMNNVMKRMTIIGSFVLIPTLIASIYGMNFGQVMSENSGSLNMPELAWVYGYPFALGSMIVSCIGLYIYFKKKKWL
jgi:magnesium transporter